MTNDEQIALLQRDGQAGLGQLFSLHQGRLARMVRLRLDSRLARRVDADDVLQEAYLDAAARLDGYLADPNASFFVWLRWIVNQTLVNVQRRHLGAKMRDAFREVSIGGHATSCASSAVLTRNLIGTGTSPSQAAIRAEIADQIERTLDSLDLIDREVLVLRHFEELDNHEVAEVLGISQKAASNRYIRAIARLKGLLESLHDAARARD